MLSVATLRTYLTFIQIVAYVLLLRRLIRSGLYKKYQYFSLLIAFESIRLPVMAALPNRSDVYAHAYFATSPIVWTLFVLVILELFQLVLRNHAGVASLGRKAMTCALAISAAIAGSTLMIDLQHTAAESAVLFNFMLLERLVMTSLLLLLLCILAFLAHFPVPLSRNIRVHVSIFAAYFAVRTVLLFLRLWFGLEIVTAFNVVAAIVAIGCLLAWTKLLTADGEALPAPRRASESDARLLAQLESINDTLLRSARK